MIEWNGYTVESIPTIYREITFRSKLEATWAKALDEYDVKWSYEPTTFRRTGHSYTPDFQITGLTNLVPFEIDIFLQIKHENYCADSEDISKWRTVTADGATHLLILGSPNRLKIAAILSRVNEAIEAHTGQCSTELFVIARYLVSEHARQIDEDPFNLN